MHSWYQLTGSCANDVHKIENIVTDDGFSYLLWEDVNRPERDGAFNEAIFYNDEGGITFASLEQIEGAEWNYSSPNFEIEKIGPKIEKNSLFPEKCNVTLATVVNKELIKVKVWERGAGLTKACGTAACATAFAAKQNGLINDKVDIEFSTGRLTISIDENNSIHMKGPVSDIEEINFKI